jgi:transmembrane sensor
MSILRIEYLLSRYLNNTISIAEKDELMNLIRDPANEIIFRTEIQRIIASTNAEHHMPAEKASLILNTILGSAKRVASQEEEIPGDEMAAWNIHEHLTQTIPLKHTIHRSRFPTWLRIAAAVIIVILAGVTYQSSNIKIEKQANARPHAGSAQIVPGTDKAILTMADGSMVTLDSAGNGQLAQAGTTTISKRGATVIYDMHSASTASVNAFNTLSTPRGGQYRLVLSDGSQVWLNAASSIRFPVSFTGNTRDVELTGEAYFEVAKNKEKPFRVMASGMQVNVLGTHFNVNAYPEEASIKTSLLEGSVKVTYGASSNLLKPGEQASLMAAKNNITVRSADMDAVMAWKNGLFEFSGADINTIMRQIARWYDVEVVTSDKISSREFEGKISRDAQLADVLRILELSDIKFSVEGKKIIIL